MSKRICSKCGCEMDEGYCCGNGVEYYCSDECLYTDGYTPEQKETDYKEGGIYWTEWESTNLLNKELERTENFDPFKWFNDFNSDLADLKDGDLLELINECGFDVYVDSDGDYSLIDADGANLGDIESEEFESLEQICIRLSGTYFKDYFEDEEN